MDCHYNEVLISMPKAILEFTMPGSCRYCPLSLYNDNAIYICSYTGKEVDVKSERRDDDCPLEYKEGDVWMQEMNSGTSAGTFRARKSPMSI